MARFRRRSLLPNVPTLLFAVFLLAIFLRAEIEDALPQTGAVINWIVDETLLGLSAGAFLAAGALLFLLIRDAGRALCPPGTSVEDTAPQVLEAGLKLAEIQHDLEPTLNSDPAVHTPSADIDILPPSLTIRPIGKLAALLACGAFVAADLWLRGIVSAGVSLLETVRAVLMHLLAGAEVLVVAVMLLLAFMGWKSRPGAGSRSRWAGAAQTVEVEAEGEGARGSTLFDGGEELNGDGKVLEGRGDIYAALYLSITTTSNNAVPYGPKSYMSRCSNAYGFPFTRPQTNPTAPAGSIRLQQHWLPLAVKSDCQQHLSAFAAGSYCDNVYLSLAVRFYCETTATQLAVASDCVLRRLRSDPTAADPTVTALLAVRGGIRLRNCSAHWRADPTASHQSLSPRSFLTTIPTDNRIPPRLLFVFATYALVPGYLTAKTQALLYERTFTGCIPLAPGSPRGLLVVHQLDLLLSTQTQCCAIGNGDKEVGHVEVQYGQLVDVQLAVGDRSQIWIGFCLLVPELLDRYTFRPEIIVGSDFKLAHRVAIWYCGGVWQKIAENTQLFL
ncbi:hypothetical protein DFH06DRAFT_1145921 [Mycena polygramma]|nr:hypothetical protein DFH06DRAFT_1145921 [Mycena polygramma]